MGVVGGSYGGFMVLSALATYPEIWSAGVDIVGIANFVTFLERTGPWRRKVREDEYGSLERDREFLESISPLHHVDQIRTPLLVVHGANDPRVPIYEAEQIVAALTERKVPVEFLRFENEGHGLVRRENQVTAYGRAAEFFVQHLSPTVADPDRPVRAPAGLLEEFPEEELVLETSFDREASGDEGLHRSDLLGDEPLEGRDICDDLDIGFRRRART